MTATPSRNAFLILGRPRSGTNYLQDLILAHPACEVQNEPISMHTRYGRAEDLMPGGRAAGALSCRCGGCLLCDLRSWLTAAPHRGFKETTLFSLLPDVSRWLPTLKVIYIHRADDEVVHSQKGRDFFRRWNIAGSRFARRYLADHPDRDLRDAAAQDEYLRHINRVRAALWEEHKHLFDHVELTYEGLVDDPWAALARSMGFLGLEVHDRQIEAVATRRGSREGAASPYGTFGA